MKTNHRAFIQRSLRHLIETSAAQMDLLTTTYDQLSRELSFDPLESFLRPNSPHTYERDQELLVSRSRLVVTLRGKTCFLGNTLPFRFLCRLAESPNAYVAHEDLLADVWEGNRSDAAVRSVVKVLRRKLREAGLADLATAIDGSVSGHYVLRVPVPPG
jgi:DNA-binding response OmpR family regulator